MTYELPEEVAEAARAAGREAARRAPLTEEAKARLAALYMRMDAEALERRLKAAREGAGE